MGPGDAGEPLFERTGGRSGARNCLPETAGGDRGTGNLVPALLNFAKAGRESFLLSASPPDLALRMARSSVHPALVSELTRILERVQQGESRAAEELLPLVYEELRRLAAHKMAREKPGQTLQPTALVHEAWLRLVGSEQQTWQNRSHFMAAAAEAMRRILIDRARRRKVLERGGFAVPTELTESKVAVSDRAEEVLAVHEALDGLAAEDAAAAELVKLRYFVGLSMPEAARSLGLPLRSAERLWSFARAWLRHEMNR